MGKICGLKPGKMGTADFLKFSPLLPVVGSTSSFRILSAWLSTMILRRGVGVSDVFGANGTYGLDTKVTCPNFLSSVTEASLLTVARLPEKEDEERSRAPEALVPLPNVVPAAPKTGVRP